MSVLYIGYWLNISWTLVLSWFHKPASEKALGKQKKYTKIPAVVLSLTIKMHFKSAILPKKQP